MGDVSKRVLVTGASGFVGEGLCRALLAAGYEVVGMARRLPPDEKRVEGVTYVQGDVRDPAGLPPGTFEGIGQIVHCVGIITEVHGRGQTFEAVHVGGTDNLLRAARREGVPGRFVYVSALGSAPDAPSAYSRSKARAEALVRDGGLPWTTFRPSVILGPGAEFLRQIEGLIRRPPLTPFPLPFVPVPGTGKNRFQPVDLLDLAACVVRCLDDPPDAPGQTYEIGGADQVTFNELIRAVAAHLGLEKKPLRHIPAPLLFAGASVLEALLPAPPVTTDQLLNLRRDNVCYLGPMREAFGIDPRGLDAALDRAYAAGM
jgi:NADH dehydrogenase